jgi:hypothetical protein
MIIIPFYNNTFPLPGPTKELEDLSTKIFFLYASSQNLRFEMVDESK